MKGKGRKERYTHWNAEFQRIARRDKKAFLSDQCKEIEENNRMGKARHPFKEISETKGITQVWISVPELLILKNQVLREERVTENLR